MTTYVIAVGQEPTLVCPSWCAYTKEHHLSELADWEGHLIHRSELGQGPHGLDVDISAATLADGTPDPRDPEVQLMIESTLYSLDQAEEIGQAILRDVARARQG